MIGSCRFEGCTFDETGSCALERDPATCSNRVQQGGNDPALANTSDISVLTALSADQLGSPVLTQPVSMSAFASSRSMGLEDLNALMGTRYVNVVGILGDPESGKTACLVSLYLLVSHAMLDGWSFADSKSLSAFEEIARGARDWNEGQAPEQMTVHTELVDDGSPGFLHLKLIRCSDSRCVDLALPDIPGEWTQALVTTAKADRLDFIKSAEVIWIVLDGRTLADIEKRQGLIARVGQLAGRLSTMFAGRVPRLLIVVTHHDLYPICTNVADRLQNELIRRSVTNAKVVSVAPFSDDPDVIPAGFGIAELINQTVGEPAAQPIFWKSTEPKENDRAYLNFRRNQ